jgi:hypothetical protein
MASAALDDAGAAFDPYELGEGVTPAAARAAAAAGHHVRALLLACHLNERGLLDAVLGGLPAAALPLIMAFVPPAFLARLVALLAERLHPAGARRSPHLDFDLRALLALLSGHAKTLRDSPDAHAGCLRDAQRALLAHRDALSALVDANRFALDFLVEGFGEADAEAGEALGKA